MKHVFIFSQDPAGSQPSRVTLDCGVIGLARVKGAAVEVEAEALRKQHPRGVPCELEEQQREWGLGREGEVGPEV
jgi:hypothetical protein